MNGADGLGTRVAFRCPARETGKIALFPFSAASGWHAPFASLTAPDTAGLQAISIDSGGLPVMFRRTLAGFAAEVLRGI